GGAAADGGGDQGRTSCEAATDRRGQKGERRETGETAGRGAEAAGSADAGGSSAHRERSCGNTGARSKGDTEERVG
ncbi:hypothetical protein FKM82_031277, partial [Ascaphus truei]